MMEGGSSLGATNIPCQAKYRLSPMSRSYGGIDLLYRSIEDSRVCSKVIRYAVESLSSKL